MRKQVCVHEKKDCYLMSPENLRAFITENTNGDIGSIRLNLATYFLSAYYSSTYGNLPKQEQGVIETNEEYPRYLANLTMIASTYGVDVKEYSNKQHNKKYNLKELHLSNTATKQDVTMFLKEVLQSINGVSDFSLVDRCHEDESWFNSYPSKKEIDLEDLSQEYINKRMGHIRKDK